MRLTAKVVIAFVLMSVIVTGLNGYQAIRREARLFEGNLDSEVRRWAFLMQHLVEVVLDREGAPGLQKLIREADAEERANTIRELKTSGDWEPREGWANFERAIGIDP